MYVCVGVLLVVSVGVALGVFVGGVLLVAAARYFKRYAVCTNNKQLVATAVQYFQLLNKRSLVVQGHRQTMLVNGGRTYMTSF